MLCLAANLMILFFNILVVSPEQTLKNTAFDNLGTFSFSANDWTQQDPK